MKRKNTFQTCWKRAFYARKPSFPPLSLAMRIKSCLTLESAPISLQNSPMTCEFADAESSSLNSMQGATYKRGETETEAYGPVSGVESPYRETC